MLVWLNGSLVPPERATISIFDRSVLFGEGLYEVVRAVDGRLPFLARHESRLAASLAAVDLGGVHPRILGEVARTLLEANDLRDASIYLQVTRGGMLGTRRHLPHADLRPVVFAFAAAAEPLGDGPGTISASIQQDPRWLGCAIKSTNLLGNVLAIMSASASGDDEAVLVRDELVSEGTSTNVLALVGDRLVTPPTSTNPPILAGVNRAVLLDELRAAGDPVIEEPLPVEALRAAREVIVTSSRRLAAAVTRLDGRPVGDGRIGRWSRRCFELLRAAATRKETSRATAAGVGT